MSLHSPTATNMETIKLTRHDIPERNAAEQEEPKIRFNNYFGYTVFIMLLLIWPMAQQLLLDSANTAGPVDPNIWLLIMLGLISFLTIMGLCRWLVQSFWISLGLPALGTMVLQYKQMELWQQLGFYWLSFALLLLAAVGCLAAIC